MKVCAVKRGGAFRRTVRTIDRPGQLHAVTYVLSKLKYNVDELELRPAERRFRQQTVMTFLISKRIAEDQEHDVNRDLAILETAIGGLVGVLNFSLRLIDVPAGKLV